MPVWCVTGKLGSGKTLVAVSRIQKYLNQGRKVATNLDLNLEHCINPWSKNATVYRLPDVPTAEDFKVIGQGYEGKIKDDESNGLVVLDECAKWLNSRGWNDPNRKKLIDYFIHLRKLRWDLIIIIQDVEALDKQFRDLYCEMIVYCSRTDRYNIPLIGGFLKFLNGGDRLPMPKIHVGTVMYNLGMGKSHKIESWVYRGTGLYKAYDTEQGFDELSSPSLFQYLPPHYTYGRYYSRYDDIKEKLKGLKTYHFFLLGALLGSAVLNAMTTTGENPNRGIVMCNDDWKYLFGECTYTINEIQEIYANHKKSVSGEVPPSDLSVGGTEPVTEHPLQNVIITGSVKTGTTYEYLFSKNGTPFEPFFEGYRIYDGNECKALALNYDDPNDRVYLYCDNSPG